jgi:hypothetical protein
VTTATRPDQTYLVILSAAEAQEQARVNHNARILAEHGTHQLGRPHPKNPDYRIWNGNLTRIGHHDPTTFVHGVNQLLPSHMYVDMAHHEHAHLADASTQWIYCRATADGAVPLTIAITQTRGD